MEGEDSEQPEDTLEQEPVEQDFCLESILFTAPLLPFFAGGTGRRGVLGSYSGPQTLFREKRRRGGRVWEIIL